MTQGQIQIEIRSIIDSLSQLHEMATWTASENLPDYLDEIADEVNALSTSLKDLKKYADSIKKTVLK